MGFGGNNGLTDFKDILGFSVQSQTTRAVLFALSALAVILGYLVTRYITTSKAGKVIIAVRDAEARTRFTGYRVEHYKLFVFVVSAVLAGIAGALYVPQVGIINPSEFSPANSIERSSSGWRSAGADAGRRSARRTGRQRSEKLVHRRVPGPVAVCPWRPVRGDDALSAEGDSRDGAGLDRAGARPAGRKRAGGGGVMSVTDSSFVPVEAETPVSALDKPQLITNSLLYLDGVSVTFDGFRAINELSLVIEPGEMRAIIGPNGAGKTTMMDIITGKTRPDKGDVIFAGEIDLTTMDEAAIANLGIGRKFQRPTVFESHSVEDNILIALAEKRGVFSTLFARTKPSRRGGSTRFSRSPVWGMSASVRPPISRTVRSNGWRSAC